MIKTEKEIIRDHLDTMCDKWLGVIDAPDALPYFIRQFEDEVTDTWSALDLLYYLRDNDFQIL